MPDLRLARRRYDELETLGRALAGAIRDDGRETLIVASTDMSHYVSQKTAEKKDMLAIRKVLDLDPAGLFETVTVERISMCGFQPTDGRPRRVARAGRVRRPSSSATKHRVTRPGTTRKLLDMLELEYSEGRRL